MAKRSYQLNKLRFTGLDIVSYLWYQVCITPYMDVADQPPRVQHGLSHVDARPSLTAYHFGTSGFLGRSSLRAADSHRTPSSPWRGVTNRKH